MSAQDASGTRANQSGKKQEARVEAVLKAHGFELIPARNWREATLHKPNAQRIAVLGAPYKSLYGHRAKIEFLLIIGKRQILVETKSQQSPGSYDEKLPFVYLTAKENLAEREYVLVMAGDGWRKAARAWIEERAFATPGFTVLRDTAFAAWLRKQMP